MDDKLKNCWEIKGCCRETKGEKTSSFGECIASRDKLGHSCWVVAGTLCGGTVQGTFAEKEKNCLKCNVYKLYHRTFGRYGHLIPQKFPEEEKEYKKLLSKIMFNLNNIK